MLHWIARLTMAKSKGGKVLQADDGAVGSQSTPTPIFTNPKALTFPILVALIKGGWLSLALIPWNGASSVWFPFFASLLLGLLVAISNLLEQKTDFLGWALGVAIGVLNSLVVFGAVVAIPKA